MKIRYMNTIHNENRNPFPYHLWKRYGYDYNVYRYLNFSSKPEPSGCKFKMYFHIYNWEFGVCSITHVIESYTKIHIYVCSCTFKLCMEMNGYSKCNRNGET